MTVGAFDFHDPPSQEFLDACIHCGFCLPTCPTYVLWGEEMDSPRGRIHLMQMGLEGEPLTDEMTGHFDACLGCMACVTACPSGVRYDRLIASTRQQLERRVHRAWQDRAFRAAIFRLFPYPKRLRVAAIGLRLYQRLRIDAVLHRMGVMRRLPARLRALESLTPRLRAPLPPPPPRIDPRAGEPKRATVAMLTGCVQRVFFDRVNAATTRVLSAEGCEIVIPPDQSCCGALSMHAGREAEARTFARRTVDAFDAVDAADTDVDAVVVNAAGCGSAMKEYGELLRDDPAYARRAAAFAAKVRDVSEFLSELGPGGAPRHPLPMIGAYHDACHLAHAQGIRRQPREVLSQIPGLTLLEVAEPDICCGSAGIYNLVEPEPAAELGERKARNLMATGAQAVVTSNPGCTLQIREHLRRLGHPLPVLHPAEVLDASIRGISRAELLRERAPRRRWE
jgi:glycolate oxidase iron-sulfur subunit